MTSILIHGGDQQKRKEAVSKLLAGEGVEEGADLIEIGKVPTESGGKVGINEIKTFLPHLHVRSLGSRRGFVIFEAQRLTVAAQNTLLKILEEPPAHLVIILTVPNPRLLLPTVVSRCLTTETQKVETKTQNKAIEEILSAQSGRRLVLFEEKIGYRQESVFVFLDEAEAHLGKGLNPKNAQSLTRLWQAKKLLRSESANIKLIVDELLLSTPFSGGESKE